MGEVFAGQCPYTTKAKSCICSAKVCPLEVKRHKQLEDWYAEVSECTGIQEVQGGKE